MNAGLFSTGNVVVATPVEFFEALDREFAFTLDVCASDANAKCAQYFTRGGLSADWGQNVCWMNPPYGRVIMAWIKKAWQASQHGATVVALVPSRTDTEWWHRYVMRAAEIRFVRGRIKFALDHDAPFPSAVVVFRPLWSSTPTVSVA